MIYKGEVQDVKGSLIIFLAFSIFLLLGGICTEPKLHLERGTVSEEPVFTNVSKFYHYSLGLKEFPQFEYEIRYIYSYLSKKQVDKINTLLVKGTPVEIYVAAQRNYPKTKEIYAIKANDEIIYSLEAYEALRKRELIASIGLVILCFLLLLIYTKSKWKENDSLVFMLGMIGLLTFIIYIQKG